MLSKRRSVSDGAPFSVSSVEVTKKGGTNWTLGNSTRLGLIANGGDTWYNTNTIAISDVASLNNSDFQFRVVSVFFPDAFTKANFASTDYAANSAYGAARNIVSGSNYAGGTWRFDMVTVNAVPEPSSALLGSLGVLALLRRRR